MTTQAVATKWGIDPTHTEVQFKVKHLVISTVTGYFKKFSGSVESDSDDFDGAQVSFSLDVNSIETNQADRDNHLKSADFFEAAEHPTIDFEGTLKKDKLVGDLTIRGTKKNITLDVDFGGIMVDPYGNTKAGFEINGKINRKEFGLNWGALTEAVGVVVVAEVTLLINAQLVKRLISIKFSFKNLPTRGGFFISHPLVWTTPCKALNFFMPPYKPTLRIIMLAGLVAGILDITAAILIYCIKGSLPIITLFQSIARGVLGDPAFQGGWSTATLGLLLHFVIATLFAAGYSLVLKVIPTLYKYTLAAGLGYA
ncbi:MAG: YceI family protein [Flammeovirgaceae bacterium]|nr:YceI family protein [Flammeovirgaceae bacterium]